MNNLSLSQLFLKELEAEVPSTRKCLERVPESLYSWKPHEKSMEMGYLTHLVAEIPNWITLMLEKSEIDLATYQHFNAKNTAELIAHFEENLKGVRRAFKNATEEEFAKPFSLKSNGQVLYTSPKIDNVSSTINHWVHHRGQLTVYLRLNNIDVPSIYGPSADDKGF